MSNRVIKISIVLIFMLFSACLFNFCFAVTTDNKLEELDYTVTSSVTHDIVYSRNITFNFIKLNVNYEKLNANNTDSDISGLDMEKAFYLLSDSKELRCLIPQKIEDTKGFTYNWYCTNQSDYIYTFDFYSVSGINMYLFVYDFSINKWVYLTSATNGFAFNKTHYILDDNIVSIYSKIHNTSNNFIVFEGVEPPPSDEKLINDFKFDVKLIFEPGNDDVPNPSKYVFRNGYDCLVQHSLNNWNYYNVTLDIELSSYTGIWLKNFTFDYYNSSHNLKYSNEKIKEKISLNILEDEYYSIKTAANDSDSVILTYNIYSKFSNEFLYKRVIKFCFDKGKWWDVSSKSTGNIISDEIYSANGNIVDNNNNELSSNGTILNKPINNYNFDDLYSLDKDTLHSNVSDLINDSANFFDLFSLFLLMLPGWISSLLYLFLFGIIVITLLRFIRGA